METVLSKSVLLITLLSSIQTLATANAASTRGNKPRRQADAALTISATQARQAAAYVSSLSSGKSPRISRSQLPSSLQDCTAMMANSADRLQRSVAEMKLLGQAKTPAYVLHLSNVQTWVSAALTDQDMCINSLSSDTSAAALKEAVRRKVASVRQVTSNALSLVNKMN